MTCYLLNRYTNDAIFFVLLALFTMVLRFFPILPDDKSNYKCLIDMQNVMFCFSFINVFLRIKFINLYLFNLFKINF